MFREMRRNKQLLTREAAIEVLKAGSSGVLGVSGDDDYPYTVPVNYVYQDDKLFFHCATEGHKLDGIRRNEKVCFCVIDQDEVVPEAFATHYRSVTVFGRARVVTDDAERRAALELLLERFCADYLAAGREYIERDWARVSVVEIQVEHLTGKAARALMNHPV